MIEIEIGRLADLAVLALEFTAYCVAAGFFLWVVARVFKINDESDMETWTIAVIAAVFWPMTIVLAFGAAIIGITFLLFMVAKNIPGWLKAVWTESYKEKPEGIHEL